jgi:hypothetical protein
VNSDNAANAGSLRESRQILIAFCLLLAVTGAIYWPGLSGDLVLDDPSTLAPIARLARGELTWREALVQHDNFRPLSMASFLANWLVTGDRVWPLKLTNLVIHLLAGVLVFLLSDRLLARPVAGMDHRRRWVALWIAACWLLAPLLVSTVLYVTQRMAALAALFSLAALLAYVCGRERIADDRPRGVALIALGLGVLWPLAIISKENGVLVPLLVIVVELFFFDRTRGQEDNRLTRRVIVSSVAAAMLVGVLIVIARPTAISLIYEYRPFTLEERVLTEWRILFDYVSNLILLPGGSPFGIYHDDYPLSRSLIEPASTLLAGLAWMAVLIAGWLTRGTRSGVLIFGLWFYLAAHAVESTVWPLELYFEHRNYLPSVGIFFSVGYGGYLLVSRVRLKRVITAALILVPIGYGAVTYHRVLVWQSWERMLLAALSHYPDSTRVHTGLANLRVNQGKLDEALVHLERAAVRPGAAELGIAVHVIGAHCLAGRPPPPAAYARLERARPSDDFYTLNSLAWLTQAVERGECRIIETARVARALHGSVRGADRAGPRGQFWLLHTHAARLLAATGEKRTALHHLDVASNLEPERLEAGLLALRYRLDIGEIDAAKATLLELKQRDTGRVARHSRLIGEYERQLEGIEEWNHLPPETVNNSRVDGDSLP